MWDIAGYLVIAVVSCYVNGALAHLYEGDNCTTESRIGGTCKFLIKCQSAIDDIRNGILPSDICGFMGTQPIVCCPNTNSSSATTTKTLTTRRPTSTGVKVGARAAEMCRQYAEYAYEIFEDPSLFIISTFSKKLDCAFEKEALIVGGTKASRKEFPHMAQIGYISGSETSWACSGSLISKNFILTAGHCLFNKQLGSPKIVRMGVTNVSDTSNLQTRNVQKIVKYPDFNFEKYNDIALLKMDRDFDMNPFVRPACIYTQKTIPYERAIASGWGKMHFSGDDSKDLLKVVLEFFNTTQCNHTYRREIASHALPNGIVEDTMICAGSSEGFKDTCQGYSGGPLQVYHEVTRDIKCMYNIVGVASFGESCGLAKNVPGVYTRVSAYVKWIEDTVWPS